MADEKKTQEQILNTINEGITALREKTELLETKGAAQETVQNETKATIEKITAKIDEIEVETKKIASLSVAGNNGEPSDEHKALMQWFRTGAEDAMLKKADGQEVKVLRISDQATGGYLTSPEMATELLKNIVEYSPIRTIARVKSIGKGSYKIRKRTGIPTGGRSGETETRTATTGLTYGMEEVPTHEYYAFDDISRWNLEDSDFNLEAELNEANGEAIGVLEGTDFVTGDAVKKPEGFMTNASIDHVASGDANLITADGLKALYFAPKGPYVTSGKFVMNRATMLAVSILKTGTGTYLLSQLGATPAWYIMGSEVVEVKDMPNISAGTFPVAFGDFKKGYLIVDRTDISYLRDPYTQAASGAIRFWMFKRTGGQVILPEAIWKLEIAAS